MNEYVFMSFSDFAKFLVCLSKSMVNIDFTFDNEKDKENDGEAFEPEGWYGTKCENLFACTYIILGYYGAGAIKYINIDDPLDTDGDIENEIVHALYSLGLYDDRNMYTALPLSGDPKNDQVCICINNTDTNPQCFLEKLAIDIYDFYKHYDHDDALVLDSCDIGKIIKNLASGDTDSIEILLTNASADGNKIAAELLGRVRKYSVEFS